MSGRLVQQIADIARNTQNPQLLFTYGELETYFPDTHAGIFRLPGHPESADPSGQTPSRTGAIPIGTFFGGPKIGAQFPPPPDAQALLIYIDTERVMPICAVFLFNAAVDNPPYPDGKTWGFKDRLGSEVKITDGGKSLTDGSGGVRLVGASYGSVVAPLVELGSEGRAAVGDAVVTQQYLQTALNAVIANTNTALAALARIVQSGPGVAATTVSTVTATGSAIVKAAP